jgi:hypothetical protein
MLRHVDAVDPCRAGRWLDEVEEEIDGRRLARAVGAEEAEDVSGKDGQREVVESRHAVIALGQMNGFKHATPYCPLGGRLVQNPPSGRNLTTNGRQYRLLS